MFGGGYGVGGGPGGFVSGGGFSGAERSQMMFPDMDDEDEFQDEDYGTEYDDEDEDDYTATESELLAMEQQYR